RGFASYDRPAVPQLHPASISTLDWPSLTARVGMRSLLPHRRCNQWQHLWRHQSRQRTVPSFHRALLRTKLGVAWPFSTD
ncbi:hypothetical protein BS50DRAFT_580297, partial [Corynespora cassiicola Philippines]